jgi:transcriptional regulator GlxA family with amidase domain
MAETVPSLSVLPLDPAARDCHCEPVAARIEAAPAVLAWIRGAATSVQVVASVCTGAFPLALAGLLDGRTATTHWEDQAELQARFPAVTVVSTVR